jgi:prefoldin subunit 5
MENVEATSVDATESREAINGKYQELCTQRGSLTHQIDRLSKQLSIVDTQIDGLDIALSVVTQLEAGLPEPEAGNNGKATSANPSSKSE